MNGYWALFVTVALLCAATFFYRNRNLRLTRSVPIRPRQPALTMQEAWNNWISRSSRLTKNERDLVDLIESRLAESALESVKQELLNVEIEAKQGAEPWILIRRAIMDALDTGLLNEAMGELDENVKSDLHAELGDFYANEVFLWNHLTKRLLWTILRWYSSLKYDDCAKGDWFDCYLKIAGGRARRIVATLQPPGSERPERADFRTLLQKAYAEHGTDRYQESLVTAPRKATVRSPDEKSPDESSDQWTW